MRMMFVARALRRGWRRPRRLNRILFPLSLLYSHLMRARVFAYQYGLLRSHRVNATVIVVGNLTVGGAGKTPLVIEIANECKTRGLKPGVIARGYRSHAESQKSREVALNMTAVDVGDEALLILQKCEVPVAVGRNRVQSARLLIDKHSCDVIISDDGFQHLALQRDLDIVVIDGDRGFGNNWCLPAGPLRESKSALARAGIVVINNSGDGDIHSDYDKTVNTFTVQSQIETAVRIGGENQTRALGDFVGQHVHAIAATGNPGRFFRQLRAQKIEIVEHAFPDHHHFCARDLDFAKPGGTVLLTEKDAVKCAPLIAAGKTRGEFWKVPLIMNLPPEFLRAVFARIKTCSM